MPITRSWQRDIQDAEALANRNQSNQSDAPAARVCRCYVCNAPATQWISSSSQRFSAPRCDACAAELKAFWGRCGVTDIKVGAIAEPESVNVGGAAS